nr:discoidin domain-containing protein [uncultured Faecalicoccus sp.]
MSATASSQQNGIAGEGLAEYVLDGNENTIWHTQYSPSVDSFDKQWIELQLNEPTTVAGVRLLQRQGRNGLFYHRGIDENDNGCVCYNGRGEMD